MKLKIFFVALLLIAVFGVASTALAMTDSERQVLIIQIQAQITLLVQQVQQLLAQQQWCHTFNDNLGYVNSGSSEISFLHIALLKEGISYSPDGLNIYSTGTMNAIVQFQTKYGIYPNSGYVGSLTRAKLNQLYQCNGNDGGNGGGNDDIVTNTCNATCVTNSDGSVWSIDCYGNPRECYNGEICQQTYDITHTYNNNQVQTIRTLNDSECITPAQVLTRINITPATLNLSMDGNTGELTAETLDQMGSSIYDAAVNWTSSNNSVATIDSYGRVTPVGVGTAYITASSGSIVSSNQATVNVTAVPESTCHATCITNPNGSVWSTDCYGSNPQQCTGGDVCQLTYDENNIIVGGIVQTIRTLNGSECRTPEQVLTRIDISPTSLNLTINGSAQELTAEGIDQGGASIYGTSFNWTSNNTSVATVNSYGRVSPVSIGTAYITASSGSIVSNQATVNVTTVPVSTCHARCDIQPPDQYAVDCDGSTAIKCASGETCQLTYDTPQNIWVNNQWQTISNINGSECVTPACTSNDWTYTLDPAICPQTGQQTKTWTKVRNCSGGVDNLSSETINCIYQSNTCTSFTYTPWSPAVCGSSRIQTETVLTRSPAGCTGGSPVLTRTCTCVSNYQYSDWSTTCTNNGSGMVQTRTVTDLNGCYSPITGTQPCSLPPTADVKFNNSDGPIDISHYSGFYNISWTSTNANYCTLNPTAFHCSGGSGCGAETVAASGNLLRQDLPVSGDTNYGFPSYVRPHVFSLVCTGPGGTASDSVSVGVY